MTRYELTDSEVETLANALVCYAEQQERHAADGGLNPRLRQAFEDGAKETRRLISKLDDESEDA